MNYITIIMFFVSLVAILSMIGRKLIALKNGSVDITDMSPFEFPYNKEIRALIVRNVKKCEYVMLVLTLRLYMGMINFLKNKYGEIKNKMKNRHISEEKQETSKFLKIISDYKRKIRIIKHIIREEDRKETD